MIQSHKFVCGNLNSAINFKLLSTSTTYDTSQVRKAVHISDNDDDDDDDDDCGNSDDNHNDYDNSDNDDAADDSDDCGNKAGDSSDHEEDDDAADAVVQCGVERVFELLQQLLAYQIVWESDRSTRNEGFHKEFAVAHELALYEAV